MSALQIIYNSVFHCRGSLALTSLSIHVILSFNCNTEDDSHLFNFLDWELMARLAWKEEV